VNYAITYNDGQLTINARSNVDPVAEEKQNNQGGTGQTTNMGSGAGSSNVVMTTVMSGGNVVLSTTTFSAPVTINTSGQTMTLSVGSAGVNEPMTDVGNLPVFTQVGGSAPALQGNFIVQQSSSAISMTPASSSGQNTAVPSVSNMSQVRSAPFTLTMENGMTLQMTASVTADGVLVVTAPDAAGSIDVRQAILMGAQVVRQELQVELGTLTSAVFVRN